METGNGHANLLRYYYNQLAQSCDQFQYTGSGGNENSFLTLKACESRCPVFINPCAAGEPQRDELQNVVTCSVANPDICNPGYWCHIGANEQTTICCPGANPTESGIGGSSVMRRWRQGAGNVGGDGDSVDLEMHYSDICNEPRIVGTGDASLPRYYFNSLTRQCLPFMYTGIAGNQNNFFSRAECQNVCPTLQNPCSSGEPATGANGQYIMCSSSAPNVCPSGFWCHLGVDSTTSICCPGSDNPCQLPLASGYGMHTVSRWYFDTNLRRCTRFTYLGNNGNSNNFLTMQECQMRCPEFQNPCSSGDPAQAPSGGILFCSANQQTCPYSYFCHIGSNSENTVCCPGAGDPCMSAMLPGTGVAKLARWYFNQNSRQCLQFTYTGSAGNQNNFLSEASCMQTCPVFRNPCPDAGRQTMMTIIQCSAQNPYICPSSHWCHIGGTADTTVCCPGASSDPCQLGCNYGTPNNNGPFTRWSYDATQRICKSFQYSGIGGNENNFLTREECAQKCPEFVNPCYNGDPYREPTTNMIRFCINRAGQDCPQNFYCHIGANAQSTVCCPGGRDPCTAPLSIGNGPANLPRWYFNKLARRCQQFFYTSSGGNENNFLSITDCQQTCPEFSNPCANGAPLTTLNGIITYCTAQNPHICPQGHFCHIGATQESTVCCPGVGNPCTQPMDVGRGSSSLMRYFFNQQTKQCIQFSYTGEGGNSNNFLNLEQCRQTCPEFINPCRIGEPYRPMNTDMLLYCSNNSPCPSNYFCQKTGMDESSNVCCPNDGATLDPCITPAMIGHGNMQLTRYYFNAALGQCIPFVFSGSGGNSNNFQTIQDCANACIYGSNNNNNNNNNNFAGRPFVGMQMGRHRIVGDFNERNNYGSNIDGRQNEMIMINNNNNNNNNREINNNNNNNREIFSNNNNNNGGNYHNRQSFSRLCPQGDPLLTETGHPVSCSLQSAQQCPHDGFVCNVMANGDAFCCPDPRNFCLHPRNPGTCQPSAGLQTKYGYNPATDSCVGFKFTGCGGNLNNFNSQSECANICCNKGYNLLMKLRDDSLWNDDDDIDDKSIQHSNNNDTSTIIDRDDEIGSGETIHDGGFVRYNLTRVVIAIKSNSSNETLTNDDDSNRIGVENEKTTMVKRMRAVKRLSWLDILRFW